MRLYGDDAEMKTISLLFCFLGLILLVSLAWYCWQADFWQKWLGDQIVCNTFKFDDNLSPILNSVFSWLGTNIYHLAYYFVRYLIFPLVFLIVFVRLLMIMAKIDKIPVPKIKKQIISKVTFKKPFNNFQKERTFQKTNKYDIDVYSSKEQEVATFLQWATVNSIKVIVTSRSVEDLKDGFFNPTTDAVSLLKINNLGKFLKAFRMLPNFLLVLMRRRTIYFTTCSGNGYAFYRDNQSKIKSGIALSSSCTMESAIHEFAHIVDYYGIGNNNGYGNGTAPLRTLRNKYNSIFNRIGFFISSGKNIPGFMTEYSMKSATENFADHFMFYVLNGFWFRQRASNDPILLEKYLFLRDYIFRGIEYEN